MLANDGGGGGANGGNDGMKHGAHGLVWFTRGLASYSHPYVGDRHGPKPASDTQSRWGA